MDVDRFLQGVERRIAISELHVSDRQMVERFVAVGVVLESVSQVPHRLLVSLELQKDDTPMQERAVIVGSELEGAGEVLDRLRGSAGIELRHSSEHAGLHRLRVPRDRVLGHGDSLFDPSELEEGVSFRDAGVELLRIGRDGALVIAEGIDPLTEIRMSDPAVVEHVAVVRVVTQHRLESLDGLARPPELSEKHRAVVLRSEMVRLDRESAVVVRESLLEPLEHVVGDGAVVVREVGAGIERKGAVQIAEGLFQIVLVDGLDAQIDVAFAERGSTHLSQPRIAPPPGRRKRVRMVAVLRLSGKLLPWYRRARRRLPWRAARGTPDPYRVWVSELMLQQTRVETVIPYFVRFTERLPDLASLAAAPEAEVLSLWSGLGYYSRARALRRAARILVEERNSRFPEDVEGWMALPGVGRYTAGAIVSIAFGKPAPILDGNVARVLTRLHGLSGDPRSGPVNRELWKLAERILPQRSISDFNQALMELGALICTPRAPRCLLCPLREDCVANREGLQESLPELPARPKSTPVVMAAAVVEKRKKVLLYRRTRMELLKDLWELPLGECRNGEDPREAIAREARGTYGIALEVGEEVARVKHSIMNRRITLHAFEAELATNPTGPTPAVEREYRWVGREEILELAMSSMMRKVLRRREG